MRTEDTVSAAARMRRSRERRKAGIRVLPIEVSIDTVEVLIELDYLAVEDVHDMTAVAAALGKFIESTAEAVTCNGITLSEW